MEDNDNNKRKPDNKPEEPPQNGQYQRFDRSERSNRLHRPTGGPRHIRASGGYRNLRSFQVATVVYDTTFNFCERFLAKHSRMAEQMVQAARSGRQNIAEGSRDAATSSQTELRLVGIARGSLDELLLDYEDFLRQRRLPAWTKDCSESREVRSIGSRRTCTPKHAQDDRSDPTDPSDLTDPVAHAALYARWLTSSDPVIVANALICLIHQANYLLDRQLEALENQFVQGGGYSEQLAALRIAERQRQVQGGTTPKPSAPTCPRCGKPMVLRTARKGRNAGSQFWGCSGYPECKTTRNLDDPTNSSDQTKDQPQ